MIKSVIILFMIVGTAFFCCCGARLSQKKELTQIRVINSTAKDFTHVTMFSMPIGELKPGDSSEFKPLRFDPLKHDPLIYCMNENINYGRYLKIPEKGVKKYTYTIDSIKNRLIYVSSREGL
ncbi:hypothetical protein GTQ34_04855 [Muricauda sp. JGD-17]|uniref:Lipoprotein n=1 Tax=Flagellimonas ochracea TaxID=2696472 RepID=A0A964TAF6_9FLAO|nr:hypothetical protein [Allomuricauda ochracea]NAY91242.1 hypothetical protein [Allomuricauda ochracea]